MGTFTTLREHHYTVLELAKLWNVSTDLVRKIFLTEPGVIIISRRRRGPRIYRTLRIPHSVAMRVYHRLTLGAGQ